MRLRFKQLLANNHGVALIEFALVLPILLLLIFGVIEVTRFIVIAQRLDKAAYSLADITSQYQPATPANEPAEISDSNMEKVVFAQFGRLMQPFDAEEDRVVIMTSIHKEPPSGALKIKWQLAGGGTLSNGATRSVVNGLPPSAVSPAVRDTIATFADEMDILNELTTMQMDENMVVCEVFYEYKPIIRNILLRLPIPIDIAQRTLKRRMFFIPRNGSLLTLPPSFVLLSPPVFAEAVHA